MIPNNVQQIFREIRLCEKCKNEKIRTYPQEPGMFSDKTRYLFVAQNPGFIKSDIIPSDKFLLNKFLQDDIFHNKYIESQKAWKFWTFITRIIPQEELDFVSIINVCRCPTLDNQLPTYKMTENCKEYLIRCIELINPVNIICVGIVSKQAIQNLNLDNKYNIINTQHYSWLNRISFEDYQKEIERIKGELK